MVQPVFEVRWLAFVSMVGVFRLGADGWAPQETTENPSHIVSGFLNFLHKNPNYLGGASTNCGPLGSRGNVFISQVAYKWSFAGSTFGFASSTCDESVPWNTKVQQRAVVGPLTTSSKNSIWLSRALLHIHSLVELACSIVRQSPLNSW
jgi:hypothetical protein